MQSYIPEQVFNIIFEYGLSWVLSFRLLNKQLKQYADEIIKNVYYNSLERNYMLNKNNTHVFISEQISSSMSLSYFTFHVTNVLMTTPVNKITIMQNMFIYDIVFRLWGYRQRFSIYKRLPLLFERSFRLCSVQKNYKHYVKQFYRRILLCIKIVDSSPSVEQLLNMHC